MRSPEVVVRHEGKRNEAPRDPADKKLLRRLATRRYSNLAGKRQRPTES